MYKFLFLLLFSTILNSIYSFAQENGEPPDSLRKNAVKIFIDCVFCDMDYIRREIPFVNYVRDVREAELYIRETMQPTGSGGNEYYFIFQGQKRFNKMNDTLVYSSRPDDTRDHTRTGRTNILKMGLMRYVARTPIFREVQIKHTGKNDEEDVIDKWNNWVFELETRPRLELQESLKELSVWNSFNINRITPDLKVEVNFNHMQSRTKYTYEEEENIKNKTTLSLKNLLVKSLGSHWSTGGKVDISTSTFSNKKLNIEIYPALEYNLFPYSESTHRQLRFLYSAGYSFITYKDTTIYNKIKDNLVRQQLQVAFQVQEKWGSINLSLEGSNYLHDFSKNKLQLEGSVRIRIVKGLSVSIRGSAARIRDQLSLVKGEASEADILLKLQELATGYNVDGGIGITYTFGSIFNNVVNPRFGNGNQMYYRYGF